MEMLIASRKKNEKFDSAVSDSFQLPPDVSSLINNSYYFGGNNEEGCSLIMRIAYRNNKPIEIFVIYRTEDGRFYMIEKQEYPIEESPLKPTCVEAGSRWNLKFDGTMVEMQSGKHCHCTFDVNFTATLEPFSALHHSDFHSMVNALAREEWNKEFFNGLTGDAGMGENDKKYNQIHYEQTGQFEGKLTLDGEERTLSMTAARDHSFGKRDWNNMSNHVWLLAMSDKGECLNVSLVNFKHLKGVFCGYSNFGQEKNSSMTGYDIISYDHYEGKGPDVMVIDCHFDNGETLHIKASRVDNVVTPFDGGNYYFQEGVGDFDINGIKARGSLEYGYNKDTSRWHSFNF